MLRLIRFIRLSRTDRKTLIRALFLLWVARLGLWFVPFQRVRALFTCVSRSRQVTNDRELNEVKEIARAVKRMSRYVPASTCLVQALVMISLLEEAGLPGNLRIGVVRKGEELQAHAWVESLGRIAIGGNDVDLSRYTVLHAVEGT